MEKAYEPQKYEAEITRRWLDSNAFAPNNDANGEPFCIVMPPPNANGSLHAGHLMFVVEDIATRYARMCGRPTLWLPGTDHAGIETQVVYERQLEKEGKSRFDLGQDKFYDEVMNFTLGHQHTILSQMQSMGFSADWNKLKFTLDDDIITTVYDTFEQMLIDGHIYRGNRIVNWCPRCNAAFADIELDHEQRDDEFYTLDYGSLQIATTRPETIFADSAVAVNPKDPRYKDLIGKTATIPLINREIPIIADEHVDPEAGTGALKVTPAHDFNDYEIGKRHNLAEIIVIDFDGKLINVPDEFAELSTQDARVKVAKSLESAGKLVKREPLTHAVAIHDRCKTVIEPLISEQWFLRISELNKPVIEAIESGKVSFYPARFKQIALDWLTQEHDWCISRQIWWGIRIPIYYKTSSDPDKKPYLFARSEQEAREYYGEGNYRAETDTFDTWFSSGQWPYATLQSTGDFEQFYPTSVMATARDILHKWVTRMIMFSLYKTGTLPFRDVYLWGMVTDEHGAKLSKSKGNYGDPMEVTRQYGTDALRLALSIGITPGNDGKLSEEKIKGYRNFCNKLWNVARFIESKTHSAYSPTLPELTSNADHWLARQLDEKVARITKNLDTYRYSEAGQLTYSLLWEDLADKYLEYAKQDTNLEMLVCALETILKLIHPFAPFVSEAIWDKLSWHDGLLINTDWPIRQFSYDSTKATAFELEVLEIIARSDATKLQAATEREIAQKKQFIKIMTAKINDKMPEHVRQNLETQIKNAQEQISKLEGGIGKAQTGE